MILLQEGRDAPLHRFAPAPQLQGVSRLHTDGFSDPLKPPSVQHLFGGRYRAGFDVPLTFRFI